MDIYEEIVRLRQSGRRGALATIVNVRGSIPSFKTAKMLVRDDGSIVGTIGGGCVEAEVWNAAREVMATGKPRHMSFNLNQDAAYDSGLICGGQLDIFIEAVLPPPRAIIFGAGHISKSLAATAATAGFACTVVDDRETFANRERFPDVDAIFAEPYEQVFPQLPVNSSTYLVIVTRGHRDDMRVLEWALGTPARYIAMIGSKRKVINVLKELHAGEAAFRNENGEERLFAPMGLEIGAVTPEEIAIAVVAEMIAVRRGAEGAWRAAAKTITTQERFRALLA